MSKLGCSAPLPAAGGFVSRKTYRLDEGPGDLQGAHHRHNVWSPAWGWLREAMRTGISPCAQRSGTCWLAPSAIGRPS